VIKALKAINKQILKCLNVERQSRQKTSVVNKLAIETMIRIQCKLPAGAERTYQTV